MNTNDKHTINKPPLLMKIYLTGFHVKSSQMRSCVKVFTRLSLFVFADSLNLEEAIGNHVDSVTDLKPSS